MANVIEIIIKARDEANATLAKTEASVAGLGSRLQSLAPAFAVVGVAAAAAATAAFKMTVAAADQVEKLDNLARATGLSTTELQVYRLELEKSGQSFEQMPIAIRFFQNAIAANGAELAKYGITSDNVKGGLVQLGRALQTAGTDAEKTALISATLGSRNIELAASVIDIATNYDKLSKAASAKGSIFSEDGLNRLRAVDAEVDKAKESWQALTNAVVVSSAPAVTALAKMVEKFEEVYRAQDKFYRGIGLIRDEKNAFERGLGGGESGGKGGGAVWGAMDTSGFKTGDSSAFDEGKFRAAIKAGADAAAANASFVSNVVREALKGGAVAQGVRGGDGRGKLTPGGEVNDPGTRLTDTGEKYRRMFDQIEQSANQFGARLYSDFANTFARLTQITSQSNNVLVQLFTQLANAIIGTITDLFAKLLTKGILTAIGSAIGGPVGGAILGVAGGSTRSTQASGEFGAGNVTYNINSFDAKSALQQLSSPSGALRAANSRLGDIRLALR